MRNYACLVNWLDCATSFALWIPGTLSIISSEAYAASARDGTSTVRVRTCVCVGVTHTILKRRFESRIWAPKAPFSLAFHGRLTPLAVYQRRSPCRFGAPERAVSTRFEIDSGIPRRACVRANGCVSVRGAYVYGNRISAFVEAALETALTEI